MDSFTKKIYKIKWFFQDLKRLPACTYLCLRFPFLKIYNKKYKFFQTSCWYYAIPKGWREAFGLQLCKEIKESLLRTGGRRALKAYQIDDIKEKWGLLDINDTNSTVEVTKILHKYEMISMYTCIECGVPATVRTTDWICPYCDKHVGDHYHVHFGHENCTSWYGWHGNIDHIPNDIWNEEEETIKKYDESL